MASSSNSSLDEQPNLSESSSEEEDQNEEEDDIDDNVEAQEEEEEEEVESNDEVEEEDRANFDHDNDSDASEDNVERHNVIEQPSAPVKIDSAPKPKRAPTKKAAAPKTKTSVASVKASSSSGGSTKVKATTSRANNKDSKMPEVGSNKLTTKEMIIEAVAEMNNKKGSSVSAIRKFVTDKYNATHQRTLLISKLLRTADQEGWLVQTAGVGAQSGSYFKLSDQLKSELQAAAKKKNATAKKQEKEKPQPQPKQKVKEATKRKMDKQIDDKEVLTKKKKAVEAPKKKANTAAKRKVQA